MSFLVIFLLSVSLQTVNVFPDTLPHHAGELIKKAVDFEQNGKADSAAVYYQQAAQLLQEEKSWDESVKAWKKAGDLYFSQRKSPQAIYSFNYLLDTLSIHLTDTLQGELYYKIGLSHARMAQFVDALENMKQACQIRANVLAPYNPELAESYHMLGRIYFTIGNFQQSLNYQQKYLTINQHNYPDDHIEVGDALHFVGLSYSHLLEHDLALQYYFKSMQIVKQADPKYHDALSHIYNNIGLVYGRQKLHEEELSYILKAIDIKKEFGMSISESYHNLGKTYLELGRYSEAREVLQTSLEQKIKEVGAQHVTVSNTLYYLAELQMKRNQYDSVLYYADQALAIRKENYGNYGTYLSTSYTQYANLYQNRKEWDKALNNIQFALGTLVRDYSASSLADNPSPDDDIIDYISLLDIMRQKTEILMQRYAATQQADDLHLAYSSSMAATDMIGYIYRNLNDSESRTYLADNTSKILELALQASYELYQKEDNPQYLETAFQLVERNKAQSLIESITAAQWKQQSGVQDALLEQEQELNTKLAYFEKLLFEEESESEADSVKVDDYKNQIFALHRDQEKLNQAIKEKYPQYYHMMHEQKFISLAQVQEELLQPDELMVEYFQGDSALYCIAISRERASLYQEKPEELPITDMLYGLQQRDYQAYSKAAYQLYTHLLAPILQEYPKEKLIIIPDDQLGYIPFESLLTQAPLAKENYKSLRYLVLDHTISYQYSANLLASIQHTPAGSGEYQRSFAGYAPAFSKQQNPLLATRTATDRQLADELEALPFAEEEVQSIAQILKGEAHIRGYATEKNFKATASDSRIIHLASHMLIDDRNPLYSKLVFSPTEEGQEDGLLHTFELYNMHLKAEMVTLSACNTGVGKLKKGEGIISLARGFMYAGVPNVLMSLWAVSDRSTSELMQSFYQALSEGDSKANALRTAKLAYLEQADANTAAPYYWSGFVLISNNQDVVESKFSVLYFLLPLLALILLGWLFFRQKIARKTT
ncbi:CHAT domain-containing protein [Catalinimonas niigatensis]|uniref:CHAT domain-containing protein n=1 Tax=Catalinimonas niigatensis TaxID=1397264 RepID=UPI002666142D|nr:CHAT domain-containing tetratricopeptide repeat protein [Catalinimonas niigatensis]WPP52664.1 CHAT domain-containing tetratricopeptide repeat protein [Catalinimonas niigatensis]